MSRILISELVQDAVYWAPSGDIDDSGQVIFSAPVAVKCRWDDETIVFMDREGNEQVSNAQVRVASDLVELGVLWKGLLADIAIGSIADPFLNQSAWEIRKFEVIPDRHARSFLRIAYL